MILSHQHCAINPKGKHNSCCCHSHLWYQITQRKFFSDSFSKQNVAYKTDFCRITSQLKCLLNDNISDSRFRYHVIACKIQLMYFTDQSRHFLSSCGWLTCMQNNYHGILSNTKLITDLQHIRVMNFKHQLSSYVFLSFK